MSSTTQAKHKAGAVIQAPTSCSVCLEVVSDGGERSIAKLKCGHHFHLDCIGSAFNAKGTMQCPNCRQVENGQWLYANGNGCHQRQDSMVENIMNGEEYDVYAGMSELFFPNDLMWCPYQNSYAQLSLSLGDTDNPPAPYADLVVNVLFGEHMVSFDAAQMCPYLQTQHPRLSGHVPAVEDNFGLESMPLNSHGAPSVVDHGAGQVFPPPQGRWAQRASMPVTAPSGSGSLENRTLGGVALHDRPRWSRSDADGAHMTGSSFPQQIGDNGVYRRHGNMAVNTIGAHNALPRAQNLNFHAQRGASQAASLFSTPSTAPYSRRGRIPAATQVSSGPPAQYFREGQMLPGSLSWDAAVSGRELGHGDGAVLTQWRQEVSPTFPHHPQGSEVQRWAPPQLSGLYGMHSAYDSDFSRQAGFRDPEAHFANQFQGHPFQAFPPPFMAEPQVDIGSFQPSTSINPSR